MYKLNNTPPEQPVGQRLDWVKGNLKNIETNENGNKKTYGDAAEVMLRGQFMAINAYLKKKKDLEQSDL